MHSSAQRVAKNTGILYARMAITVFISLYATRLVLNALGANDFGLFNVVGGAIAMLTFLNNAMAGATQRFLSYAEGEGNIEKQKNIFNVSIVLHAITAVAVVIILEIAGYFFFNGILRIDADRVAAAKYIYQFLIVSTFFTIVAVPYDAVINAHENMLFVAILGILEAIIKLAIALLITVIAADKLIVYGLLMAALSILLLIIRQIYCQRKYIETEIDIKKYYQKDVMKEMTGFAGWNFLGASSSMIANYGQGIILNMFFGTVVNAAQGIVNQISGQLGALSITMLKALNPIIAKSEGSDNRQLMLKASMMGTKVAFFLMIFFYIPVMIEMPFILKIWLKIVPEYTVIFGRLLMIKILIEQFYTTLNSSIAAVGNIRKYEIYNSILAIIPILLTYILFKSHFEPFVLYIVYIIYTILVVSVVLYFAKINCNLSIDEYLKAVVFRCILSFIFILSLSIIPIFFLQESVFRLLLVITISSISFIIIAWYEGVTKDEQTFIIQIIRKTKVFQIIIKS